MGTRFVGWELQSFNRARYRASCSCSIFWPSLVFLHRRGSSTDEQKMLVGKASRLTLEFGHLQDFVRIYKSLLSTKAERDLGLWLKGASENASRRDGAIVAWHEVPGTAP